MRIESTTPSLPIGNLLSFDVLEQLFLSCTPRPFTFPPKRRDPHLVLTQVCSAWRNTAFEMQLWRALSMTPMVSAIGWEPASKFAREWLSRTSTSKLSISIPDFPCSSQFLCEIIVAHSSRFETIRLCLDSPIQVEEFFSAPFDCLRNLDIEAPRGVPLALPNRVHTLHSLRHLNLWSRDNWIPFHGLFPSILQFPSRNLLTLDLQNAISIPEFHELPLFYPYLETCALRISKGPTVMDNNIIRHTCLKECILTVDISNPNAPQNLFEPLTLPCLERFEIFFKRSDVWSCKVLTSLFRRSACTIRKLSVRPHFGHVIDDIETLLRELSHVTELFLPKMATRAHDEETLRKIGTGECLPRLQTLYVAISRDTVATDRFLDAVEKCSPQKLEAEGRPVSSIRELRYGMGRNLGSAQAARLVDFRNQRMIVRAYDREGRGGRIRMLDEL